MTEPNPITPERALGELSWFGDLPASLMRRLADASHVQAFPKGAAIIRQGDPCRGVDVILSGRCKARHAPLTQTRLSEPRLLGPGSVIGIREWLTDDNHHANVDVAMDAVVLHLPTQALHEAIRDHPALLQQFLPATAGSKVPQEDRIRGLTGRIAALAFVVEDLDERAIATAVAKETFSSTCAKVLLLEFVSTASVGLDAWRESESVVEFVIKHAVRLEDDVYCLQLAADHEQCTGLASFLSHLNAAYPYIITYAGSELPELCVVELLVQSDIAFLYVSPDESILLRANLLVRDAIKSAELKQLSLHPVVFTEPHLKSWTLKGLSEKIGAPILSVCDRSVPTSARSHDRMIAHTIARCRTGLVLSAGAAKGLAHIGVIQVLEENGIDVDVVAGTSMGAYVGACWCAGHNGQQLQLLAEDIGKRGGVFSLADPVFPPRRGFIRGERARTRLNESVGGKQFSQLVRPLKVLATELDTLRTHIFESGSVADAVSASMAMPGICIPVELEGVSYTDGAVGDPLPVAILERMGVERIIAVSTLPTLEDLEARRLTDGLTPKRTWWRRALSFVNRHINYFAKGNVLDTLMRGLQGSQIRLIEVSARRADIFIQAYPVGARWYEFDQHAKYIAEGRAAALAKLDELKRLHRIPLSHETNLADQ